MRDFLPWWKGVGGATSKALNMNASRLPWLRLSGTMFDDVLCLAASASGGPDFSCYTQGGLERSHSMFVKTCSSPVRYLSLWNMLIREPLSAPGAICGGLLSRCTTVFDYPHRRIAFLPSRPVLHFPEA